MNRDVHDLKCNQWRLWRTLGITFLAFLLPVLTWADSDTRPATKQEKEFFRLVMTTVGKALPSAPKGWETLGQSDFKELQRVAAEKVPPFFIDYYIHWQDTKRKNAADEKQQNAVNKQFDEQKSGASNADNSKLMAQYEKLAEELGKAAEAGDMKKVEKLQAQMEKITAKLNGEFQADDDERNKLMESMSPHDVEAGITVCVNTFDRDFLGLPKKEKSLGAFPVYRTEGRFTPEKGWVEGYTFVFLGAGWKYQRNGEYALMRAMPKKGFPRTKAQTIEVMIQADPQRAKQLIKQIDWDSLNKLIAN